MKSWLITGCSSEFGKSLANYLLDCGEQVAVTARKTSALSEFQDKKNALILSLDVTDKNSVADAAKKTLEAFGKIDVLVNNAGYGFRGAVEEANDAEMNRIFQTNFFGPIHLIQEVLPSMREKKSGTIINFSSIAAFRTAEGSGYYGATKAALESASEALRKETAPLGIRVMVVEPGPFRTDFAGRSLAVSEKNIDDYAETSGKRKFRDDPHTEWTLGNPNLAAKVLKEIVELDKIPFRILLGSDAVKIGENFCAERQKEIDAWKDYSLKTDEQK